MHACFIDHKKSKTELVSYATNYVLPFSGSLFFSDLKEPFVYINGDAIPTENSSLKVEVKISNFEIEADHQQYEVHVLGKPWSRERLYDYNSFGLTFDNNLIDNRMDAEILFDAINDETDGDLHLSFCTFDRKYENVTQQQDVELVREYAEHLPYIFYKPKQHLKQVNEIRPASVVSRIGQESISHLASHSEHWKAIKANGLVPERLMARVLEDDVAIYENIAVKSLIDRLYQKERNLSAESMDCEMQMQMEDGQSYSAELPSYFQARNILMKGLELDEMQFRQALLEEQRENIERILDIVNQCKSTPLYRKLRKHRRIQGKLKKTNIFMMDKSYKYAYKLWNLLDTTVESDGLGYVKDIEFEYDIFCKTLFLFALKYFNFLEDDIERDLFDGYKLLEQTLQFAEYNLDICEEEAPGIIDSAFSCRVSRETKVEVDVSGLSLPSGILQERPYKVECFGQKMNIYRVLNDREQNNLVDTLSSYWDEKQRRRKSKDLKQILYNAFFNIQLTERKILFVPWKYELPDNGEEVKILFERISDALPVNEYDKIYILTISRPNEFSAIEDITILNGMLTYGDANIQKGLSKQQIGVIPISMSDINSYRRYTKVLLRELVLLDDDHKVCPICGNTMWKTASNVDSCQNCGFEIIKTQCPQCKERYSFSRHKLPKVNSVKIKGTGIKVLQTENLLGYKNITDVVIEDGQINPICPCCGN